MIRSLILTLPFVLLLAAPAPAGDEEDPAARHAAAVDRRDAPSEEGGFDCEGRVYLDGTRIGTFRFSARVAGEGEDAVWVIEDRAEMAAGGDRFSGRTTARLDRRLVALDGEESRVRDGAETTARFSRTAGGYEIVTRRGGGEAATATVSAPAGLAVGNVSAGLLLMRGLPARAGKYEYRSLDPVTDREDPVETVLLVARGEGDWEGQPALLFSRTEEEREITIALDPGTRAFLGMRMDQPGGIRVSFRLDDGDLPEGFAVPATTAEGCALVAALAFRTRDGELLSSICDWPAIVEDLRAARPDEELEVGEVRRSVIESLEAASGGRPRAVVAAELLKIADRLRVEGEGDRVTVVFPEEYGNLRIPTGRFGGEWRIVSLR